MAAYKRSDPTKLAKEREAIAQSQAEVEKPEESTLSLIGRALKQGVEGVKKKVEVRRRRQRGYGPPPQVPGAMQYGFKKPDTTA